MCITCCVFCRAYSILYSMRYVDGTAYHVFCGMVCIILCSVFVAVGGMPRVFCIMRCV